MTTRLLFLVTEDWLFCLHRMDLARAARDAGYEVLVATGVSDQGEKIIREGFKLFPIPLNRGLRNPLEEFRAVYSVIRLYRDERPDIVHNVATKAILYGTLASQFSNIRRIVNTFTGLGSIFTSPEFFLRVIRFVLIRLFRWTFAKDHTAIIFQNQEDRDQFVAWNVVTPQQSTIIRGSGVDIVRFSPTPEKGVVPIILLPARMLWEKGVGEFVAAAKILLSEGINAEFALVGMLDFQNPNGISETQIQQWQNEGIIQWWGHRKDMPTVLSAAHIIALPTFYGEGLPKVLLEAASCSRPIIATNVRGCREFVIHNKNGLLIPPKNPSALAEAIRSLVEDPNLRRSMGEEGRKLVVDGFSKEHVAEKTLNVYHEVLGHKGVG